MEIKLNTESTTTKDIKHLCSLFNLFEGCEFQKLKEQNAILTKEISESKTQEIEGKVTVVNNKEAVLLVLDKIESGTVTQIAQRIDNTKQENIQTACSVLKKEGILATTTTRPMSYFIKSKGNPELRSMFPKGTKASFMK